MERELFSWTGWDGDPECMIFYNPVLLQDIGGFKKGTKFSTACIQQPESLPGILQLHNDEGNLLTEFELHLQVGKQL